MTDDGPLAGEFGNALLPVCRTMEKLGVRYYLSGSLASSLRGVVRATAAADLVASMHPDVAGKMVSELQGAYYGDARAAEEAVRRGGSFNLIHNDTMLKIDVFAPKDDLLSQSAMSRSESFPPGIRVGRADDVLLAKLRWFDQGGRVSERQWSDIVGLLKFASQEMEIDYVDRMSALIGLQELLRKARSEAER